MTEGRKEKLFPSSSLRYGRAVQMEPIREGNNMAEEEELGGDQEVDGNPPERQRAPRSDRGQVRINDRDHQLLRFIAEQQCISVGLLAILMQVTFSSARSWLARHIKAGHLRKIDGLAPDGSRCYSPTRAALQLLQTPYTTETPEQVAHLCAITATRMYLQGVPGCLENSAEWSSERYRRSEHRRENRDPKGVHFEDGILRGNIAVEVELSAKAQPKLVAILRHLFVTHERIVYVVSAQAAGSLRQAQILLADETSSLHERLIVLDLGDVQKTIRAAYERKVNARKSSVLETDALIEVSNAPSCHANAESPALKAWSATLGAAALIVKLNEQHVASAARLLADVTPLIIARGLDTSRLVARHRRFAG
jgi:hypothetical protein